MKFTPEEDELLIELKQKYPDASMSTLCKHFDQRCVTSLYQRWNKINPSFSKGQWDQSEKVQLFNTMFDVISANIETISQSLDIQRYKKDIYKQVYKVKEIATAGYLGPDYEVKMDGIKPEKKRKREHKIIIKIRFRNKDTVVKGEVKDRFSLATKFPADLEFDTFCNNETKQSSSFDLPQGLSRKEFLSQINSLPSIKDYQTSQWTVQEDYNLLQLYQSFGPNWPCISLSTDFKSEEEVKHRFCDLIRWCAYCSEQKINPEDPLESRDVDIAYCVEALLIQLDKEKTKIHKRDCFNFTKTRTASDSDTSND
ncbi:unnamed protein product [Moneuplotes crassus]|uniref:Myb-like domain-containing protein n=1 Tax=Euplotes crassus TaxID=5936 RepID=A0AAD1U2E5_EUPCR|nr:unnamed protein product [Moneuplotes crassus]